MTEKSENPHYILDSQEEVKRLSKMHEILKDAMGGLLLVPVELSAAPLRVLDSATADGTWLRDLASSSGSPVAHTLVGTDINQHYFPEHRPPGTIHQVQNINEPWPQDWHGTFDVVHQRLALVNAGPVAQTAVTRLAELVKPGGWIQLIEGENVSAEGNGPAMHDFATLLKSTFAFMGVSSKYPREIHAWLREAGFVDVQERVVDVYYGASNPSPQFARNGIYCVSGAASGLVTFAKGQSMVAYHSISKSRS
ncbi:hypothetical protein W97_04739 [Coniosporium apollinis CBS 100218]|uniref:Methyltransferase domain-containing protein n=1 Tax=Coniosporium apollinis (strain CBS 100218) TaxID=1168221 RepID=R7YUZ9_CONA1|nr:uncharacterized protein W97_04739 [Coniosporium apollinis CBS 100218]EON65501.1 hypothetical protein W97_04739 [Coniosporium apollinis CBS 100218]